MTVAATVTSKGQITLPKELRNRLHVEAGDVVVFEEREGQFVVRVGHTLRNYRGFLKHAPPADADTLRRAAKASRGKRSARHA